MRSKSDSVLIVAYVLVGLSASIMGFFGAMKFLARARSQGVTAQGKVTSGTPESVPSTAEPGTSDHTATEQPAPEEVQPEGGTQEPAVVPQPADGQGAPAALVPPDSANSANPELPTLPGLGGSKKKGATAVTEPNDSGVADFVKPLQSLEGYIYDPAGRRDPFKPYVGTPPRGVVAEDKNSDRLDVNQVTKEVEPLQRYDIRSYEVMAILWSVATPRAILKDPTGEVYMVTKGQKIGKNDGYVADIREGELVVIEAFDDNGKHYKEASILAIRK